MIEASEGTLNKAAKQVAESRVLNIKVSELPIDQTKDANELRLQSKFICEVFALAQ